jgi:hypothetical protein
MIDNHEGQFPQDAVNASGLLSVERPRFSICSIVNRPAQYAEMVESFRSGGFTAAAGCEFLYLDNSTQNRHESYEGYNFFLQIARGEYIILCHQDVFLIEDGYDRLNEVIEELNSIDPDWALFGNSGGFWPGGKAIRIRDKVGYNQSRGGPFPQRCHSLDENFIVVRANANLALSRDIKGFHLYGTDLCLVAATLGLHSYVADFFLYHAGEARMDPTYYQIRLSMIRKYSRLSKIRMIRTPCMDMIFTPWAPLTWLANTGIGIRIGALLSHTFGKEPKLTR